MNRPATSALVTLSSLAALLAGCAGSRPAPAPVVVGTGVQVSIPSGWVDAAAAASALPAGTLIDSEYVVGVQSRTPLDGFEPNFLVTRQAPSQVDWAAGDGLAPPTVDEIALYSRTEIDRLYGATVTPMTFTKLDGERAIDFSATRMVDRCSCLVTQATTTTIHAGYVCTAMLSSAAKSTPSLATTLAALSASWMWNSRTGAGASGGAIRAFDAARVLLTVADIPAAFRVSSAKSVTAPGSLSGHYTIFQAASPLRSLLSMAFVFPDQSEASASQANAATLAPGELAELTIPAGARALLPEAHLYEGASQSNGTVLETFRLVWRDGVTVNDVGSASVRGAFTQAATIQLALKQEGHVRVALAHLAGS